MQARHYSDIDFTKYAVSHLSKYASDEWENNIYLALAARMSFILGQVDMHNFVLGEDACSDLRFAVYFENHELMFDIMRSGVCKSGNDELKHSCLNFAARHRQHMILETLLDYWFPADTKTSFLNIDIVETLLSRYPTLAGSKLQYRHTDKIPANLTGMEVMQTIGKLWEGALVKDLVDRPRAWERPHNGSFEQTRDIIVSLLDTALSRISE